MTIWFFVCFPICDEIVLMISAPVSGAQVSVAVKASRGWISPTLSVNSNGSNLSFITTDADGFSHLVFIQLSNCSLSHMLWSRDECRQEISLSRAILNKYFPRYLISATSNDSEKIMFWFLADEPRWFAVTLYSSQYWMRIINWR